MRISLSLDTDPDRTPHFNPVLENTLESAVGHPVRVALLRPCLVQIAGGMGLPARMAARLIPCFQHPAHLAPRENGRGGNSTLNQEPGTMIVTPRGDAAPARHAHNTEPPPHFMRRVARQVIVRAAVRGRLSWPVALHILALIDRGAV